MHVCVTVQPEHIRMYALRSAYASRRDNQQLFVRIGFTFPSLHRQGSEPFVPAHEDDSQRTWHARKWTTTLDRLDLKKKK